MNGYQGRYHELTEWVQSDWRAMIRSDSDIKKNRPCAELTDLLNWKLQFSHYLPLAFMHVRTPVSFLYLEDHSWDIKVAAQAIAKMLQLVGVRGGQLKMHYCL